MEHFIVGSLLVIIIATSGWLIGFYNNMINKRALVEDGLRLLDEQVQKREVVLQEDVEYPLVSPRSIKLAELDERIEIYSQMYRDKVDYYNKTLSRFPNNLAGKILGVQQIPYYME